MKRGWVDYRAVKAAVSMEMALANYGVLLQHVGDGCLRGRCPLPTHSSVQQPHELHGEHREECLGLPLRFVRGRARRADWRQRVGLCRGHGEVLDPRSRLEAAGPGSLCRQATCGRHRARSNQARSEPGPESCQPAPTPPCRFRSRGSTTRIRTSPTVASTSKLPAISGSATTAAGARWRAAS